MVLVWWIGEGVSGLFVTSIIADIFFIANAGNTLRYWVHVEPIIVFVVVLVVVVVVVVIIVNRQSSWRLLLSWFTDVGLEVAAILVAVSCCGGQRGIAGACGGAALGGMGLGRGSRPLS